MSDKINNDEDKPSMISKSRCNCDDKIGLTTDNSGPRADDNDRESADAVTPDQTEVKGDGKAPEIISILALYLISSLEIFVVKSFVHVTLYSLLLHPVNTNVIVIKQIVIIFFISSPTIIIIN